MRALLIDDDAKLAALLKDYLAAARIEMHWAPSGEEGLKVLPSLDPAIVILDVTMPGKDGFEVCREIRTRSNIPILMLTARGETTDRIVGLELGADDYLPKPFEPRELVARLQSVARRSRPRARVWRFGTLEILVDDRDVTLDGKTVELTSMEYELLFFLASNPGRKLDRDEIMNHLKGIDSDVYSRSVDILVSRVRAKLKDTKVIKTVYGTGYVFVGTPS